MAAQVKELENRIRELEGYYEAELQRSTELENALLETKVIARVATKLSRLGYSPSAALLSVPGSRFALEGDESTYEEVVERIENESLEWHAWLLYLNELTNYKPPPTAPTRWLANTGNGKYEIVESSAASA